MCFGWKTRESCSGTSSNQEPAFSWLALVAAFFAGALVLGSGKSNGSRSNGSGAVRRR